MAIPYIVRKSIWMKKHRRLKSEINCIMMYQHPDGASENEVEIEYVLGFSPPYTVLFAWGGQYSHPDKKC